MFTHQTILSLQVLTPEAPAAPPVFGHFRDYHFAPSVLEAKEHLLRCLRRMNQLHFPTPDVILVDAGRDNMEIKNELELWMSAYPQLGRVEIRFPAERSWIHQRLNKWSQREDHAPQAAEECGFLFPRPAI